MPALRPSSGSAFRERLWPAPWVFVATGLVMPASLLVFLPISLPAGIAVALGLYGAVVAILLITTPTIEVTEDGVRTGKAQIDRRFIGGVTAHEGQDATSQRGVDLDARAWLLLRGWITGVVRIEIVDPDDPTPYWLISSRRPHELATALQR